MDFLRLGFRFLAPFGRKLIEARPLPLSARAEPLGERAEWIWGSGAIHRGENVGGQLERGKERCWNGELRELGGYHRWREQIEEMKTTELV